MSILRDILDTKEDIENLEYEDTPLKYNGRNSVAREAQPGVLQFPVLVSSSLSLENVTMISKALERTFVSFVTVLTSIDSVTDERDIKSYINKIHQNMGVENNIGGLGDLRESVFSKSLKDLNHIRLFEDSQNSILNILESCCTKESTEETCEKCFNEEDDELESYDDLDEYEKDCVVSKIREKKQCGVSECFKYNGKIKSIILKESSGKYTQLLMIRNMNTGKLRLVEAAILPYTGQAPLYETASKKVKGRLLAELKEYVPDLNLNTLNEATIGNNNYAYIGKGYLKDRLVNNNLSEADIVRTVSGNEFQDVPNVNGYTYRDTMVMKDVLRDNDVKKANEMVPTLLHLKTYFKDKQGDLHAVDYVIGIKTVIHPVKSESMCENIVSAMKRGKAFFNLMRLTTGEISFFKDFVFALGRTKDDIKTKYKDNPWWNSLIRRRKYSRALKTINAKSQLVPNTSIVISMDEADKIKVEHNIDLMNPKIVKEIMDQLFLISFVVIDPSVEIAHILTDGQLYYQQMSFASLERENSNAQRDIKNIMQVLGRM